MTAEQKEQKNILIQNFRYGIIAELTNPYLKRGELKELVKEKASREYEIPFSSKTHVSESCIRKWLKKYELGGREGLIPRSRLDTGRCKCLQEEEQSMLLDFLEKNPDISGIQALKILKKQGKIKSHISKSSLSRLLIATGMNRETRRETVSKSKNLKFDFHYPLECVQADALHAFGVADDKGKIRKAILIAFIDDATRRIVYANFSFTEKSLEFELGIFHILKAHGRIVMLYVDNGSTFVSHQTQRILDILGIRLVHSRPGKPAGRGKIERFFRTVREQFLRPLDKESIKSLADLNIRFKTWLESDYHRNPHKGLQGNTPLEAWLSKAHLIVHMDPSVDLDEVKLHQITRKVYKDSTITLAGVLYEVPGILAGKVVKVKYNPHLGLRKLKIYYEGVYYGEAKVVDTYANTKVKRDSDSKTFVCTDVEKNPSEEAQKKIEDRCSKLSTKAAFAASRIDYEGVSPSQENNTTRR